MKNTHFRMMLITTACFIGGIFASNSLGQVTVGQTYILVQGTNDDDNMSIYQRSYDKALIVEFRNVDTGAVASSQTVRHNPDQTMLIVAGMAGDDQINVRTGMFNLVYGISGKNDIRVDGTGVSFVIGGFDDDDINLYNDGIGIAVGGAGNDRLWGRADQNYLYGEDGDDLLVSENQSDDYAYGGNGHDMIAMGGGTDRVFAGPGSDLVWIAPGASTFDMGPIEASPLPRAIVPDYFPVEVWGAYYASIYLTQEVSLMSERIKDAIIMVAGGFWRQG